MDTLITQESNYTMSDINRRKIKIRRHNSMHWLEDLEKAYPLPDAPPDQCRDAFLLDLLQSFVASTESETSLDPDAGDLSSAIQFGGLADFTSSFNAEEKLLNKMVKTADKRVSLLTKKSEDARLIGADISKLLKERYGNIASALGFMAVLYQLQELKDRLLVIREMWSMNASTNKALHMFSWSIKDYFLRFNQPDQIYLDTAERELGTQMECYKFRMDLKEIDRLIDALVDDLRGKRDICDSSMLIIKDAEMDIAELLTKSQIEARDAHFKVAKEAANTMRSADRSRLKAVKTKINYIDFISPIEARYRIKWAQTNMEQSIVYDGLTVKQMSDEIQRLRQQIDEIGQLWEISGIAYDMQILEFKNNIMKKEIEYEETLEQCNAEIQATRGKLAKAKEDLKFYTEQIPMFHQKIAKVLAMMAQQEAVDRATLLRDSRKSSRHSNKKKAQKKKK